MQAVPGRVMAISRDRSEQLEWSGPWEEVTVPLSD